MAILEGQPAPGFSLPDKDGNQMNGRFEGEKCCRLFLSQR